MVAVSIIFSSMDNVLHCLYLNKQSYMIKVLSFFFPQVKFLEAAC